MQNCLCRLGASLIREKPAKLLACAFLLWLPFQLSAQEELPADGQAPEEEFIIKNEETIPYASNAVFIIDTIEFNIKGITKPYALIRYIDLKTGEELEGNEKLQKYIADKTQLLINQRVLDSAKIEYTIGDRREDGKYPVNLLINIVDTWNIIALPQPKYDSNTGFEIKLKARDYNFLGTMNPLRLDIGYKFDEKNRNSFLLDLESDTPFTAFGYNWNFTFNHYFSYRPDVEEPFFYQNKTGISMLLPVNRSTITFSFYEYATLNEANSSRYIPNNGEFQNGLYMSSRLITAWKIPTGVLIGDFGELTYWPDISFTFNHEFPEWPLADFRHGPIIGFYHAFGFDKIDWIHNYRKGFYVYLENSYSYNFFQSGENEKAVNISYSLSGKGHFILYDFLGLSTYVRFRHWFYNEPNYYDNAGDALRGILDGDIHADYMLSLNLDFPFKILDFVPSKWFNTQKLRFFDFEMHASPIIDFALYHDPENDIAFSFKNTLLSGGLEIIVFPAFFRSLYLRISIGFNLLNTDETEFFIGIGHHY